MAGAAPDEDTPFPLLARVGSSPGNITGTDVLHYGNETTPVLVVFLKRPTWDALDEETQPAT